MVLPTGCRHAVSSDADSCCRQPGISDAGAHLAIMQDGTSPTSMLAHWARDRTLGSGQIPIEICVMKQARDTAWLYNMMDRGTLEPGKKADLNGATLVLSALLFEKIHAESHL